MIPKLKTGNLEADVHELTVGECIKLAGMPDDQPEKLITAFLEACIFAPSRPIAEWRAEERMFAVGHYLASTLDTGPNFEVGEGARFLDYIVPPSEERETPSDKFRPLLTPDLERIERMMGDEINGTAGWIVGSLACQSSPASDDEYMAEVRRILAMPGSEFEALLAEYLAYRQGNVTIFDLVYTDEGFAAKGERDGQTLPVARFPADATIPRVFRQML